MNVMNVHRLLTVSKRLLNKNFEWWHARSGHVSCGTTNLRGRSVFKNIHLFQEARLNTNKLYLFGPNSLSFFSCAQVFPNKIADSCYSLNKNDIEKLYNDFKNSSFVKELLVLIGRRNPGSFRPDGSKEDNEKKSDGNENDQENEQKQSPLQKFILLAWVCFIFYVFSSLSSPENTYKTISWNEFFHDMLSKGEVETIIVRPEMETIFVKLHPEAVVRGQLVRDGMYILRMGEFEKFEDKLRLAERELGISTENTIPIIYQRDESWLPKILGLAALVAIVLVLRKTIKIQLPNPSDMFARERKANFVRVDLMTKEGKGITFKDVAGLHEAKVEVLEFVDYLKNPNNYKKLGAKIPKGALLLGPPGCGKTLLAKAVATEARVPFLAMAGSEFVEMLGGLGAARVRDLFKEARQKSPCIIYIDEIDAIGKKRSGENWSQNTEEEHTLNQLLVEMDGIGTKEGVIILGSTNRAEVLDKALLRAGRFDRHILIDLPTLKERVELFDIYLKKLKLKQHASNYSPNLAQLSPGMSGADIANICNEAALHAARIGALSVDVSDFDYAVERVVAGVAKKSRLLTQQEKKIVAYHEAGHALVGWLLEHTDCLMKVSIVPRTNNALGYAQYMPQDKKLQSSHALFDQMCLLLGGRVSESLTFNAVTTGAQDDLKKVTQLAYDQVKLLGMNEKVGLLSFPSQSDFSIKPYSKAMAKLIDQEANLLVTKVYKFTEKLLTQNKEKLKAVAEALLEKEALSYRDMEQLIGPPPYGQKGFLHAMIPEVDNEINVK